MKDIAERLEFMAVRIAPLGSHSGNTRWEAAELMRESAAEIRSHRNRSQDEARMRCGIDEGSLRTPRQS